MDINVKHSDNDQLEFAYRNKEFLKDHSPKEAEDITKNCIKQSVVEFRHNTLKYRLHEAFKQRLGRIPSDEELDEHLGYIENPDIDKGSHKPYKWIRKWFYDGVEVLAMFPVRTDGSKIIMSYGIPTRG